jgi:transcriptional regulator with XRE-family HTH domain
VLQPRPLIVAREGGVTSFSAESALGQRMRRLRSRTGLTQAELATAAGLSTSYVSLIESGRRAPGPEAQIRLARVLQVTPAELLGNAPASPAVIEMELARAEADLDYGRAQRALQSLDVLLARHAESLSWQSRCRARIAHGAARYRAGDENGGLAEVDAMLGEPIPKDLLPALLQTLSALYLDAGDLARAIDLARRGFDGTEAFEQPHSHVVISLGTVLAAAYRERGDLASAEVIIRRILRMVAAQPSSPRARAEALRAASLSAEAGGDGPRALLLASRALGAFAEGHARSQLARMQLTCATILLSAGQQNADQAAQLLTEAEPVLRVAGEPDATECRLQTARAALAAGNPNRAIELARGTLGETGVTSGLQAARIQLVIAEAELAMGRQDSARETLEAASASLGPVPATRSSGQAWRELGDLLARTGSASTALGAYNRALVIAGMPPLHGQPDYGPRADPPP